MTPALLAIPIARLVIRGKSGALQGACAGIVIASCALMVATGLRLAPQAVLSPLHGLIVAVGTALMAFTKIKPVWVIVAAEVIGIVLT